MAARLTGSRLVLEWQPVGAEAVVADIGQVVSDPLGIGKHHATFAKAFHLVIDRKRGFVIAHV